MKVNPFTLAIPESETIEIKVTDQSQPGVEAVFTLKRPGIPEMAKIGDLTEKMVALYIGDKALPFYALSNGLIPKLSEGEIMLACAIHGLQVESPSVDFYTVEEIIGLFYTMKEGMAHVALEVNKLTEKIQSLFENPTKGSPVVQSPGISGLQEETPNLMHE